MISSHEGVFNENFNIFGKTKQKRSRCDGAAICLTDSFSHTGLFTAFCLFVGQFIDTQSQYIFFIPNLWKHRFHSVQS